MATVVEKCVLFLTVADLTQIHFFIRHLPVADSLTVSLAVFVPAHILVASLVFDECSLSMALVVGPVTVVGISRRIYHYALAVALSEDEVSFVR